jgi:hypothetical protein
MESKEDESPVNDLKKMMKRKFNGLEEELKKTCRNNRMNICLYANTKTGCWRSNSRT